MKKFRQKEYSIKEGCYTGPKDSNKAPSAISVLSKGAGLGALTGFAVGKIAGIKNDDVSAMSSAIKGAEYGTLGGIALKIFLNYLHNPMKSVKYQEVDKILRREFGVYRLSGITVGDSISKRDSIDEKFGFNDRNVTNYKLTFCISDNKVTMYTLGVTDEELKKIDKVLDYYCLKFNGMEYSSMKINEKVNSYSVIITFTNYSAISNFIMELSNSLETRINLLDNDIVAKRLLEAEPDGEEEEDSRNFSLANVGKSDVYDILSKSTRKTIPALRRSRSIGESLSHAVIGFISSILELESEKEVAKMNMPVPRCFLGNDYLRKALSDLRYVDGFHYTSGRKNSSMADANISLIHGLLCITVGLGKNSEIVDKGFWEKTKLNVRRSIVNENVVVYNYSVRSKQELNQYLNLLMKTGIKFNIFE